MMNNKAGKQVLAMGVAGVILLGGYHAASFAADNGRGSVERLLSFSDVQGHWAEKSVGDAIQAGYVDGYEDGLFHPEQDVTRAEFVKMLISSMEEEVGAAVSNSQWYAPFLDTAQRLGVIAQGDITQDLNQPITRQEMAKLSIRAVENAYRGDKDTTDAELIYESTKAGLITGVEPGELALDGVTTRAQAVTIIQRVLNAQSGGTNPADKYAVSSAELAYNGSNMITMWETEPVELPMTYKYSEDIDVEISEIFITDMTDLNDPNRYKYLEANRAGLSPITEDYVMALKTKVINKTTNYHDRYEAFGFTVFIHNSLGVNIPEDFFKFPGGQPGIYEGISHYAFTKESIIDKIEDGAGKGIRLYFQTEYGDVPLTKRTATEFEELKNR